MKRDKRVIKRERDKRSDRETQESNKERKKRCEKYLEVVSTRRESFHCLIDDPVPLQYRITIAEILICATLKIHT